MSSPTLAPKTLTRLSRFWRSKILRFGEYEKVYPAAITPCRMVPDHIEKPQYVLNGKLPLLKEPEIKDFNKIRGMRRSCKLAANILEKVKSSIKVGVTTDEIDELVHNLCINADAYPSPLLYKGFPKSICTSVNNVAVHGIPDIRPLHNGDIVNVDITVYYKGFHGDCSRTFLVGDVDDRGLELVQVTEDSLYLGIKTCGPDVPFSAIGSTIQDYAKRNRLTVCPAFVGHGIGQYFHGPPDIYHTLNRYPGVMKPGMTFTIEPVLTHGGQDTVLLEDGWTIVKADGARCAQFEHTVLITENGAEILTR